MKRKVLLFKTVGVSLQVWRMHLKVVGASRQ